MNMSLICNSSCLNLAGLQNCYRTGWDLKKELWGGCAICTFTPGWLRSTGISARPCRHINQAPWSAQRALLAIEKAKIEYLCCSGACQHNMVNVNQLHMDLSTDKWHQSPLKCLNCIWERGSRGLRAERSWSVPGWQRHLLKGQKKVPTDLPVTRGKLNNSQQWCENADMLIEYFWVLTGIAQRINQYFMMMEFFFFVQESWEVIKCYLSKINMLKIKCFRHFVLKTWKRVT